LFETLLASTLAYYRAHPTEVPHYRAEQAPEERLALAHQYAAWKPRTPPWNSPTIQRRLWQERTQF